jgi:exodeoxyribonuclease VII small subunit
MNPPSDDLSYEESLAELDKIVRALEDGQIGLEESLVQYEKGVGLIKRCYEQLRKAELRIRMLCGQDEQGAPVLEPFAHAPAMEGDAPRPPR